jgi:Putative prokaryotic signal transducing protein
MSGHRRRGQGEPLEGQELAWTMKELLRSNDPVLLSYVSALLAEEDIDFIVADLNMSVLEGSIGALPRRVLVEGDRLAHARQILSGAGIGHVISDDA